MGKDLGFAVQAETPFFLVRVEEICEDVQTLSQTASAPSHPVAPPPQANECWRGVHPGGVGDTTAVSASMAQGGERTPKGRGGAGGETVVAGITAQPRMPADCPVRCPASVEASSSKLPPWRPGNKGSSCHPQPPSRHTLLGEKSQPSNCKTNAHPF